MISLAADYKPYSGMINYAIDHEGNKHPVTHSKTEQSTGVPKGDWRKKERNREHVHGSLRHAAITVGKRETYFTSMKCNNPDRFNLISSFDKSDLVSAYKKFNIYCMEVGSTAYKLLKEYGTCMYCKDFNRSIGKVRSFQRYYAKNMTVKDYRAIEIANTIIKDLSDLPHK